jgi:hypothetical protein
MTLYSVSLFNSTTTPNDKTHATRQKVAWAELCDSVLSVSWSPILFSRDIRRAKNFEIAAVIGIDIDSGMTLIDGVNAASDYSHILATTKSHRKAKSNSPACDRFRIIFPLSRPVTDNEYHAVLWHVKKTMYPAMDDQCIDSARFFFPCKELVSFADGDPIDVDGMLQAIGARVHERVEQIHAAAATPLPLPTWLRMFLDSESDTFVGEFNATLNRAAFELNRLGYSYDDALELLRKPIEARWEAPDENDLATIQSAFGVEEFTVDPNAAFDVSAAFDEVQEYPSPAFDASPLPYILPQGFRGQLSFSSVKFGKDLVLLSGKTFEESLHQVAKDYQQQLYPLQETLKLLDVSDAAYFVHSVGPEVIKKVITAAYQTPPSHPPRLNLSRYLGDVRTFTYLWVALNKIRIGPHGEVSGEELGTSTVHRLKCDYNLCLNTTAKSELPSHPSVGLLAQSWQIVANEYMLAHRARLRDNLKHSPAASTSALDTFVSLLTGKKENILASAVLRQSIWIAKRNLWGLKVGHHVMPVVHGIQGCGKSEAIKRLLSPIEHFVWHTDFEKLSDIREERMLNRSIVAFLDEMAHAERADMALVKRLITADTINSRTFHTQDHMTLKQNCMFIGGTNKPIEMILKDDTGMRRFAVIDCKPTIPFGGKLVFDWEAINKLDYVELWRSIDENLEAGYLGDVMDDLRKHQEDIRTQSPVEQWADDISLAPKTLDDVETVGIQSLFADFATWSSGTGSFTISLPHFGIVLRSLGIKYVGRFMEKSGLKVSKYEVSKSRVRPGFGTFDTVNQSVKM